MFVHEQATSSKYAPLSGDLSYHEIRLAIPKEYLAHWGRDKMAATLPDDTFKCKFVNDNILILIKISLNFVPKGPINNMPALV